MTSPDLHKLTLRLRVIAILERYSRIRRQVHVVKQWKRRYIHAN